MLYLRTYDKPAKPYRSLRPTSFVIKLDVPNLIRQAVWMTSKGKVQEKKNSSGFKKKTYPSPCSSPENSGCERSGVFSKNAGVPFLLDPLPTEVLLLWSHSKTEVIQRLRWDLFLQVVTDGGKFWWPSHIAWISASTVSGCSTCKIFHLNNAL